MYLAGGKSPSTPNGTETRMAPSRTNFSCSIDATVRTRLLETGWSAMVALLCRLLLLQKNDKGAAAEPQPQIENAMVMANGEHLPIPSKDDGI